MRSFIDFARLPSLVALALALLAGAAAGCTDDTSSTGTYTPSVATTLLKIDPAAFVGDVRCSNEDGALRSYVFTVFDQTDATHIATLPSSPPTSCSQGVSFRLALGDHTYTAEIDGYDVPTSALEPLGGAASGSRHLVHVGGTDVIAPRWTASCGAIIASQAAAGAFTSCSTLVDHGSAQATAILVDPLASLGELACAAKGGEVVSFDIIPEGAPLPPISGVPCGGAPITYSDAITPDVPYSFRIEARAEAGAPAVWGARCAVTPKEGLLNTAVCSPLASSGSIKLAIDDFLAAHDLACGDGGVATFEASIAKPSVSTGPIACGAAAHISPLDPGDYTLALRALRADGTTALESTCTATVIPGDTTIAACP